MWVCLELGVDERQRPAVVPCVDITKLLPVVPPMALEGVGDRTPRALRTLNSVERVRLALAKDRSTAGPHMFHAENSDIENSILMKANRSSAAGLWLSVLLWATAAVFGVAAAILF